MLEYRAVNFVLKFFVSAYTCWWGCDDEDHSSLRFMGYFVAGTITNALHVDSVYSSYPSYQVGIAIITTSEITKLRYKKFIYLIKARSHS